jgi:hypothetical protein
VVPDTVSVDAEVEPNVVAPALKVLALVAASVVEPVTVKDPMEVEVRVEVPETFRLVAVVAAKAVAPVDVKVVAVVPAKLLVPDTVSEEAVVEANVVVPDTVSAVALVALKLATLVAPDKVKFPAVRVRLPAGRVVAPKVLVPDTVSEVVLVALKLATLVVPDKVKLPVEVTFVADKLCRVDVPVTVMLLAVVPCRVVAPEIVTAPGIITAPVVWIVNAVARAAEDVPRPTTSKSFAVMGAFHFPRAMEFALEAVSPVPKATPAVFETMFVLPIAHPCDAAIWLAMPMAAEFAAELPTVAPPTVLVEPVIRDVLAVTVFPEPDTSRFAHPLDKTLLLPNTPALRIKVVRTAGSAVSANRFESPASTEE